MPTEIVVTLSPADQKMIAEGLLESAKNGGVVHVMIQDGSLKLKLNYGVWTPPIGKRVP